MKLNIFVILVLVGVVFGAKHEVVESDSSSSSISEEEIEEDDTLDVDLAEPEDIIFRNLKELLRAGDSDFGVPVWAPYVDDNVVVE